MIQILPVLDLMGGQIVRGIGGRRNEYQPVISKLTRSSQPLDVALAFREVHGFDELYLADLDAIQGQPVDRRTIDQLHDADFQLWVDAGLRTLEQAEVLYSANVANILVALETLSGPDLLQSFCQQWSSRIVFSLDLMNGQPIGNLDEWECHDPWRIVCQAIESGVSRVLLLDLADVGEQHGTATLPLAQRLSSAYPHIQLCAGGGVRSMEDLQRLEEAGVSAALVASALHDRTLNF